MMGQRRRQKGPQGAEINASLRKRLYSDRKFTHRRNPKWATRNTSSCKRAAKIRTTSLRASNPECALKAASRGHTDIRLRERGTKRVHVFNGWRQEVDKPANGPAWLPDRIVKSNVKKIGIEHLD